MSAPGQRWDWQPARVHRSVVERGGWRGSGTARSGVGSPWPLVGAFAWVGAIALMALGPFVGQGGLLVGVVATPILAALLAPLIKKVAAAEDRFDLSAILWAGLGLKFVASALRYLTIYSIYDGVGDSAEYDRQGVRLAASFRSFDFGVDVGQQIPGTGFLRYVTGLVYVFTFDSQFAGFLVFSALTFVGVLAAIAALRIAVPQADHRLYGSLVMVWPSLLFWPSSIGKDAWMVFAIGITCWGAAKAYTRQRGGFVLAGMGLLASGMLRPHVTLLLFVAMFAGYVLRPGRPRRTHSGRSAGGGFAKVLGVVVLLLAGSLVASETEAFFDIDELSTDGVNEALSETTRRSAQGGGAFTPVDVSNPVNYPWGVVTVLLRPFPFEAHNAQALVTSFEGIALLVLVARGRRGLLAVPRMLRRHSYVAFAGAYVLMFAYAFAAIGNFGILARQRAQVLLLVFVFVALTSPTMGADQLRRTKYSSAALPG